MFKLGYRISYMLKARTLCRDRIPPAPGAATAPHEALGKATSPCSLMTQLSPARPDTSRSLRNRGMYPDAARTFLTSHP